MKIKLILILSLVNLNFALGQTVTLVSDYNEGSEDGLSEFHLDAMSLDDKMIMVASNEVHGLELVALQNDEIILLKDINPGIGDASPEDFIRYQDKIYFIATGPDNIKNLWYTDGTENGTQQLTSSDDGSVVAESLIELKDDFLYFSQGDNIYKTNGTDQIEIGEGRLYKEFNSTSKNYTLYNDQLFFVEEGNSTFHLKTIQQDEVVVVSEIEADFSADFKSIFTIKDNIAIAIEHWNDEVINGVYLWNENNGTTSKVQIAGTESTPTRVIQYDSETAVMFYDGKVYEYTVDGATQILENNAPNLFQGEDLSFSLKGNHLFFHAGVDFGEEIFSYYNKDEEKAQNVITEKRYQSNVVCFNNYSFIAFGTSNNFQPSIWYYNHKRSFSLPVINFIERSTNTSSIRLIGILDNKLYFQSNLDADMGRELYFIDISNLPQLEVSTQTVLPDNLDLEFHTDRFMVNSIEHKPFKANIYNLNGQLLKAYPTAKTNEFYPLPKFTGTLLMHFEIDNQTYILTKFNHN